MRIERLLGRFQQIHLRLQALDITALTLIFSDLLRKLKAKSFETVIIVSATTLHPSLIQ